MNISLIIPTYNAEKYLPALLESLASQSVTFELIIIDSTSTDNTVNIAKTHTPHILTISQNDFDHGGTRTIAAQYATGDILVFLTQDALPYSHQTIGRIVQIFKSPKVGAAYGRQLSYEETNIFGKHLRAFNYPQKSHVKSLDDKNTYGIKTAFLSDSFAAYRKEVLESVGYFKNGLIVGEDVHAGAKILLEGHSLAYVANAKVYHSHSYTVMQEFKRYFDIGVFHKNESWLLDTFGKAEGEGLKYVKSEFSYLLKHDAYYKIPLQIPSFFLRNGAKYLGYTLGKHHQKLSSKTIKKLSMHKSWWT